MKILFMDISRNDDGHVLSVLGGCHQCGSRVITCFIDETLDWLKDHQKRLHKDNRSAIEQIGDPLKLAEPQVDRDPLLPKARKVERIVALLKEGEEGMTVNSIAEALDSTYNTVSVTLSRLHKAGKVRKERYQGVNFWKAA
jgi:DNA-binding transcriptional ArsR family regulator